MDTKKRKAAEISGGATPQAQQPPSKRLKNEPVGSVRTRQSFEQIQKAEQSKKFKEDLQPVAFAQRAIHTINPRRHLA